MLFYFAIWVPFLLIYVYIYYMHMHCKKVYIFECLGMVLLYVIYMYIKNSIS